MTLFFFNYTTLNIDKQALKLPADQLFSVLTKSCFTLLPPPSTRLKPAGGGFQAQQTNALGAEEGIHWRPEGGRPAGFNTVCTMYTIQVCSKYTK